jgi:hypothetical protein
VSPRARTITAAVVAAVIIVAGFSYAIGRTPTYESTASLVLAPNVTDRSELPNILDGFTASGTSGTYVEALSSPDVIRKAGSPPVSISVRAVPDTRVITMTASGGQADVRPGLNKVITAARTASTQLNDLWSLDVIASPSAPAASGPKTTLIFAATVLLAALGALFVLVILGRLGADSSVGSVIPVPGTGSVSAAQSASRRRVRRRAGG